MLPREEHTISSLKPYTTYQFKVRAANIVLGAIEWGTYSNILDATTNIARKLS